MCPIYIIRFFRHDCAGFIIQVGKSCPTDCSNAVLNLDYSVCCLGTVEESFIHSVEVNEIALEEGFEVLLARNEQLLLGS